jgi:hypothetical protein
VAKYILLSVDIFRAFDPGKVIAVKVKIQII